MSKHCSILFNTSKSKTEVFLLLHIYKWGKQRAELFSNWGSYTIGVDLAFNLGLRLSHCKDSFSINHPLLLLPIFSLRVTMPLSSPSEVLNNSAILKYPLKKTAYLVCINFRRAVLQIVWNTYKKLWSHLHIGLVYNRKHNCLTETVKIKKEI